MLDTLIQKLANEMEITSSALTGPIPGTFAIPVNEETQMKITETQGGLLLEATIAPCPTKNNESFFTQALLANLLGQGTGGAALGLNDDGKQLVLMRIMDHSTDYKSFKNALEDFLDAVEFWQAEAREFEQGGMNKAPKIAA